MIQSSQQIRLMPMSASEFLHRLLFNIESNVSAVSDSTSQSKSATDFADTSIPPALLTSRHAAKFLAVSERTLWTLTNAGEVPAVRIGRAVRYDISDLRRWIDRAKNRGE